MTNTVLITGANKGIGYEVARQLGEKGWTVLLGARNPERGMAAVKELQADGSNVEWVRIDLDDLDTVKQAAAQIKQTHPELSILVNNAGIAGKMDAEPLDVSVDEVREGLTVNAVGTFAMIQAFTPILQPNRGRIINMTIPTNHTKFFHPFSYITSKSALNQMTSMIAMSFTRQHIPVEVFGVMPGGVSTDLNHHMQSPFVRPVDEGAAAVVKILLDRHNHQGQIVTNYGLFRSLRRMIFKN